MRSSGILLPVFSLPSKYGIGCFSKEAYQFVDFLKLSGQKYWQILPLGPTSYGDSPYQSFSTFAGNPYFICLEDLIEQGLLTEEECDAVNFGESETDIDYAAIYAGRFKLLRKAYERSEVYKKQEFHDFISANEFWIKDYALFMALKDHFAGVSFNYWPDDIRLRYGYAIDHYHTVLYYDVEFYEYMQFEFYNQWFKLKKYANDNGIEIIGDIPIYVAYDSADVWARSDLFQLDENMRPTAVAGCPPDGFSATGQLWGNPLYRWDRHQSDFYAWWTDRIRKNSELYDYIRIDHFRGFDEYFSIPAGDEDAKRGHWEKGPGLELFSTVKYALGDLKIIAEDLGYMTETVRQLVRDSGFPNMKVLEFAFDSRDSSGPIEYLPHNYEKNCVVYTGTHDNETTTGWLDAILPEEVEMVRDYTGVTEKSELCKAMVRLAFASTANMCIIPIQDHLGLDNSARINTPSTLGNNWRWRVTKDQLSDELIEEIYRLTKIYARL